MGYFEINRSAGGKPVCFDAAQSATIERHLALVFAHEIDPSQGDAAHQTELNEIHGKLPGGAPQSHDKDDLIIRC